MSEEVVHILRAGSPLCHFDDKLPAGWPPGHVWVDEAHAQDGTCFRCLEILGDEKLGPTPKWKAPDVKPIPVRGIVDGPISDHIDGLRAALLELAERCGELRRQVDEKFTASRDKAAVEWVRERLRTIALVAMDSSKSTGAKTVRAHIQEHGGIVASLNLAGDGGPLWDVTIGGKHGQAATLVEAIENALEGE